MAKKPRERFKDRNKPPLDPQAKPTATVEILKRRRNRRLILVAIIGISIPFLEVLAYQVRAITITVTNHSDQEVTKVKVSYPLGSFDTPELKPGGSITRVIRPDFSFKSTNFSTYLLDIRFGTAGGIVRHGGRIGSIDYSAHETFTIEPTLLDTPVQLKHSTSPGFPLSLVHSLLEQLRIH